MTVYRFPIPRGERILLLVGAILGVAVPVGVFVMIRAFASSLGMSLGDVFATSTSVRASFGAMWIAYAFGLYALLAFHRIKEGTRLEVGDGRVRFHRPGAPLLGWWAEDVTIDAGRADRVIVRDVQRGTVRRVELEVGAGHDVLRANVGHAVVGEDGPRTSVDRKSDWPQHPLVRDVAAALERDPEVV